ncbi:SDR family oxidoreductase [Haloarculaceae archaeon H-GB2-1]|nr:SDR family NAD(P)-dependent oxidoreductase [Haloarculaceae archaeon H-GB1-1]MEA5387964.1 SDR family oxidoreductase [Haloarculaceae archaeon H-GB11]MEA5409454.1 SDR family oxidoreductase [Haloarculaceae archaeon H-GB2-1]
MKLEDRSAIVTGGSSGIGRGIALELARAGADVAVGDLTETPSDLGASATTTERIRDLGRDALFRETDVTEPGDVAALVEAAVDAFGGLDVLVNNAGIARGGTVEAVSEDDWSDVLDVNLSGVYRCTKTAMEHLLESDHGRVINVASQLAFVGYEESPAYCASKGGVANLTRQLAVDYSGDGVTVNAICPGPVKTSMTRSKDDDELESWDDDEERAAFYRDRVLTDFVGEPEDVGRAAVFIASDDARFMTGHNLVIDGGYLAR